MHAGNASQLRLKVRDSAQGWLALIEITKGAAQKREQFGLVMIAFRANFDQLHEIGGGLRAHIVFADAGKGIAQRDFGERMQI